ncbi:glycosyltransferase [Massilia sp. IC2-476]|uniref:glycosyltransferase n=1 Tax=Massilia sp. IC2-476 TaxID=2887199 RepID=UPI001D10EB14|nr:glycosyltransferase [Massilia sp. IC2-476]MCC2970549.1 glycosyltransferase [Massilia sp. IC2-476]
MKLNEVQAAVAAAKAALASAPSTQADVAVPAPPAHLPLATGPGGTRRRIAIISDHASPLAEPGSIDCGGQNVYVAQLARELARAGHLVDVFTRRDAPEQRLVAQWCENIRVIHVPAGPPRYVPKEQMLPHVDAFSRYVTRFARRQPVPYDIVHANFFMSGMVAQHLKASLGLPFVITFHALGRVRRLAQGSADTFPIARMRIEAALMRAADRIIAECPQDRQDMERLYGAPLSRIAIAPCGFSPDELWPVPMHEARARLGLDDGRFVVLQLGRMVPRKGVDTVIQGVAMLRHRHGVDAQLLVVGGNAGPSTGGQPGDDVELARLRSVAADLGVGAHVRFAGQQPRAVLRDYYSAANVFASTPWYEPFGITPVEAMACARPVVGSEVGGIKSTVNDSVTGFLIPSRDPAALADRLARLHRHPDLARAMGEAGRRRACEHYTWRHVATQLAAIYADVLDATRSTAQPAVLPN